jgi:hypothetical protein
MSLVLQVLGINFNRWAGINRLTRTGYDASGAKRKQVDGKSKSKGPSLTRIERELGMGTLVFTHCDLLTACYLTDGLDTAKCGIAF